MAITVYGADWCGDTRRTLAHLQQAQIPHEYVNAERVEAGMEFVLKHNGGKRKFPTVDLGDGQVLSVPDDVELAAAIERLG